jgi:hypothetical protein
LKPERLGVFSKPAKIKIPPNLPAGCPHGPFRPRNQKGKPAPKPYKLADSGGLFLLVTPTGGKLWRLKYRHFSGEKTLSIGA